MAKVIGEFDEKDRVLRTVTQAIFTAVRALTEDAPDAVTCLLGASAWVVRDVISSKRPDVSKDEAIAAVTVIMGEAYEKIEQLVSRYGCVEGDEEKN